MAVAFIDEFETRNNRDAMKGMGVRKGGVARTYDAAPDHSEPTSDDGETGMLSGVGSTPSDDDVVKLIKAAFRQGMNYQEQVLQPKWRNSYAAFNNQHFPGSKYTSSRYRGRSRLFRPKTRSAVRRKAAEAAAALFTTSDVVLVTAENESDKTQQASAAVTHALLNYRLDRSTEIGGVPWFFLCMSAHQSAQITGICASKQYWEYDERIEGEETFEVTDKYTGAVTHETQPIRRIVKDCPVIRLYAPEDIVRDPAAFWQNQAQDSSYLILRNAQTVNAARTFLQAKDKEGNYRFREIGDDQLYASAGVQTQSADGVRRSREESGYDRMADPGMADHEFKIVWLHENFLRIDGNDWHFWTLGDAIQVSDVKRVEEVYPEQGGQRPVVIGVGALEAFKLDPMSPVESWAPLQQELNDNVNIRLDVMKQTAAPLTKVKRGRNINLKEVQNRSADSVLYVDEMEDVEFDRPGEMGQGVYQEAERLNADFDDAAGVFNNGSVQTNRQLNDTVGGMKLINQNANAMGEFDMRVWVETWVESTLRQLIKLEQYYETDQRILTIAGERAKLFQKFGMDKVTDELLQQQVQCRVNVGVGSADPMMRLQKLQMAGQAIGMLVPTAMQRMKADEVIQEVMGAAGYRDPERFFHEGDDMDPRIQNMAQQIQGLTGALEDKQADRDHQTKLEEKKQVGSVVTEHLKHRQSLEKSRQDHAFGKEDAEMQHVMGLQSGLVDHATGQDAAEADHGRSVQMEGRKQLAGAASRHQDHEYAALSADQQAEHSAAADQRTGKAVVPAGKGPRASTPAAVGPAQGDDFAGIMRLALGEQSPDGNASMQMLAQAIAKMAASQESQRRESQAMLQAVTEGLVRGMQAIGDSIVQSNRETAQAVANSNSEMADALADSQEAVADAMVESTKSMAAGQERVENAMNRVAEEIAKPKIHKVERGANGFMTNIETRTH